MLTGGNVHLHCLATDGAYEEQNDGELRFLAAPPPTPERMMAVLAQVHEVIRAADDDLDTDPALAACVQLSLAGPHLAPGSPSAPPPMTLQLASTATELIFTTPARPATT